MSPGPEIDLPGLGQGIGTLLSLHRAHIRRHVRSFAKSVGFPRWIADMGSGNSPYRSYFSSDHYVSIDLFAQADVRADICAIPVGDEEMDLVICTEVLEHVPYPRLALRNIWRVLKPGAHLILGVPLVWGVHDRVDYYRWTEKGLTQLLETSQFEILELQRRGGLFSCIGCLVSQIPYQHFGPLAGIRNPLRAYLFAALWCALIPIPWLLAPLDCLDRRRDITLGYDVLASKRLQ